MSLQIDAADVIKRIQQFLSENHLTQSLATLQASRRDNHEESRLSTYRRAGGNRRAPEPGRRFGRAHPEYHWRALGFGFKTNCAPTGLGATREIDESLRACMCGALTMAIAR